MKGKYTLDSKHTKSQCRRLAMASTATRRCEIDQVPARVSHHHYHHHHYAPSVRDNTDALGETVQRTREGGLGEEEVEGWSVASALGRLTVESSRQNFRYVLFSLLILRRLADIPLCRQSPDLAGSSLPPPVRIGANSTGRRSSRRPPSFRTRSLVSDAS